MATVVPGTFEDATSTILTVTSRQFTWTKNQGFQYHAGTEKHVGLNRSRAGALTRVASHRTTQDNHLQPVLSKLFDEYEIATIIGCDVSFENGDQVVHGRRFHIKAADIGA